MARTKGSRNKRQSRPPLTVTLTPEERITYLANLIIDRILADQASGAGLLRKVERLQ